LARNSLSVCSETGCQFKRETRVHFCRNTHLFGLNSNWSEKACQHKYETRVHFCQNTHYTLFSIKSIHSKRKPAGILFNEVALKNADDKDSSEAAEVEEKKCLHSNQYFIF